MYYMRKKGVRAIFTLVFLIMCASLVYAAGEVTTNTTVYIINSNPSVSNVNVSPNVTQPNDPLNVTALVSDVNGIPDDIATVYVIFDMGTPANSSDDKNLSMAYNAGTGLYENISYILPVNSPFGTYNATVYTYDDFGATASNYTTFLVTDLTDPVINAINDTPDPVDPGNVINFTANVTDNVAVDKVWILINGTNYTMNSSGGDMYYYDGFDTESLYAGTHNYTVYANDTYGNDATPVTSNFTINVLVSVEITQVPIAFGNTTIPVTDRRADNGTAGSGYVGGTIKGFPMIANNTGNVYENFTIAGTNLIGQTQGSYVVGVGNVTYNTTANLPGTALTTSDVQFAGSLARFTTSNVYFWIDLPTGLPSQNYVGAVNVTAVQK